MRPVDTAAIKSEIERYEQRKRELDNQLEELASLKDRLPDLEVKQTRLTDEIETLQDELETARADLEEANVDVEQQREKNRSSRQNLTSYARCDRNSNGSAIGLRPNAKASMH